MDAEFRARAYAQEKRGYDVCAAAAAKGGPYAESDARIARAKHERLTSFRAAAIAAGDPDPHPDFEAYFNASAGQAPASNPALDAMIAAAIARNLADQAAATHIPRTEVPATVTMDAVEVAKLEEDEAAARIDGVPVAGITARRHEQEAKEAKLSAEHEARAAIAAEEDAIAARIAAA